MSGLNFPQVTVTGTLFAIPDRNVLGNVSGTSALPVAVTSAELTGLINQFTTASSGAVPASGTASSTGSFLSPSGFISVPSADYILVGTQTANASSTITFTSGFSSAYSFYDFVLENVVPSVDDISLILRYSNDTGSTFLTSNYGGIITTGIVISSVNSFGNKISNVAGGGISGKVTLYAPFTGNKKITNFNVFYFKSGSGTVGAANGGNNSSTAVVNGVQFIMDTGTISGVIKMYAGK